jgi:hypothetical protein
MSLSEDDVKKALGIKSWCNLSKDKVVQFAALMPDMGKEVSMKIIEQFPKFKEFAVDTLSTLGKEHKSTLESNDESQGQFHQIQRNMLGMFQGELDKELTPDERMRVFEHMDKIGDRAFEKDSENKRFLNGLFDKASIVSVVTVVAGVVFVGGKVLLQNVPGGDLLE